MNSCGNLGELSAPIGAIANKKFRLGVLSSPLHYGLDEATEAALKKEIWATIRELHTILGDCLKSHEVREAVRVSEQLPRMAAERQARDMQAARARYEAEKGKG